MALNLRCFGALGTLAAKLPEIIASDNPQLLEMSLAVMGVCACEAYSRSLLASGVGRPAPPQALAHSMWTALSECRSLKRGATL